jgi:hypothetical protein
MMTEQLNSSLVMMLKMGPGLSELSLDGGTCMLSYICSCLFSDSSCTLSPPGINFLLSIATTLWEPFAIHLKLG